MKERVLKVFSQVMNVPVDVISINSSPDTISEWDSLKHMNLILALEEEFKIQFNDAQIVEMLSIGDLVDTIAGIKNVR